LAVEHRVEVLGPRAEHLLVREDQLPFDEERDAREFSGREHPEHVIRSRTALWNSQPARRHKVSFDLLHAVVAHVRNNDILLAVDRHAIRP
jgi:hypothetical protein